MRNWLSLAQFCSLEDKSTPTVLKWIKAGQLTAFRVGGRWRIYIGEYDRYKSEGLLPKQDQ